MIEVEILIGPPEVGNCHICGVINFHSTTGTLLFYRDLVIFSSLRFHIISFLVQSRGWCENLKYIIDIYVNI